MEGCADVEHDRAFGSGFLAQVGGALHGGGCSGDDGLVGRVEVGGGDHGEFGVEGFGLGGGGQRRELVRHLGTDFGNQRGRHTKDGGHRTFSCGDGLLHVASAVADGAHGVGKAERSCGDVRGVLAERVTGG